MSPGAITFARPAKHGRSLAKTITLSDGLIVDVKPAPQAGAHRFRESECADIRSLMAAIADAAGQGEIAVRGDPIAPVGRRAIYGHAEKGPAGLRIVPRLWVAFDWDDIPIEPHQIEPAPEEIADDPAEHWCWSRPDPLLDPEIGVRAAQRRLPPAFRDVACGWQVSASAGFKSGWRLRTWHWLDHPCTGEELKVWLAPAIERQLVDDCTLTEAQPHYLAVTVVGGADPCPRRFGVLWLAEDAVTVPDIQGIVRRQQQAVRRAPRPVPIMHYAQPSGDTDTATAFLDRCVATVRAAGNGPKHTTYKAEAARAKAFCDKYSIEWQPWCQRLIDAYVSILDPAEALRRRKSSTLGVMAWVEAR